MGKNKLISFGLLSVALFVFTSMVTSSADEGPATPMAEEAEGAVTEPAAAVEGAGSQSPASDAEIASETNEPEEVSKLEPGYITVNFKGADIRTVLAYIAEVSGIDIVPAPDVKGVVDLKLTNKPWKVAMDLIAKNYGLAYEKEGDIIRVVTLDKIKQEELITQAFTLNYGKAKDIVSSIQNIVSERGKVMYDDRTNILLVTDIPTNLYKIGEIIGKLDKKTDQVLIEARVIETVLGEDEKLGIDWNIKFTATGAKRPTTLPFEAFKTPFNTKSGEMQAYFPQVQVAAPTSTTETVGGATVSTESALFPSSATGVFSFPYAAASDFSFGTLDFSQFQAVLEMIKSRSDTDLVSNPRIATLNNTEALINVGQTINLPTYERNSTTGKMEITGYDAKDLGIILKVTPHINDSGEIVVDLFPEISDLIRYDTLDAASGIVAPVFSARQAKTQVMIKDGDTIFIGGLIKENNVNTKKKMPFFGDILGDVPYLGLLFTKKEITKRKTELVFFITVNLMKTGKEIKTSPKPEKSYQPTFVATQEPDKTPKKRMKKMMF
ncbi:MAG: secretin N-terminal domain-containing protein [Candidatus Omnitrophica bacterium]|nr:secretin N-terminal domain-containing protein [Candidatus Omnitrophota bacterium]